MFRSLLVVCALVWALLPAKATVLALSCDGMSTDISHAVGDKEKVTKFGLIVDLDNRLITGFAIPVNIINIDPNFVSFSNWIGSRHISGTIDRITGAVWGVDTMYSDMKPIKSFRPKVLI